MIEPVDHQETHCHKCYLCVQTDPPDSDDLCSGFEVKHNCAKTRAVPYKNNTQHILCVAYCRSWVVAEGINTDKTCGEKRKM